MEAGDAALVAFAAACRTSLRGVDLFGRMGGEEFAVVLVDTAWRTRARSPSACAAPWPR